MKTWIYGCDPYNSLDSAPVIARSIVVGGGYNGPLGALAYRSYKAWDFFKGTNAQRIAAWCEGKIRVGRYA